MRRATVDLGSGGPRPVAELGQGEVGMAKAELGDLSQWHRQLVEVDAPDRLALGAGGRALAGQVRLVAVGLAVRPLPGGADDRRLLERQRRVVGADVHQQIADRPLALAVGDGVPTPRGHP